MGRGAVMLVRFVAGACASGKRMVDDPGPEAVEPLGTQELLEAENRYLEAVVSDLQKLVDEQQFELGAYRRRFGGIGPGYREVEGQVLSVKTAEVGTFVAISVGSKHSVRLGDEYHLSRGKRYVGKIDIIRISEDTAIGRFDTKFNGGGPPRAGDKASME